MGNRIRTIGIVGLGAACAATVAVTAQAYATSDGASGAKTPRAAVLIEAPSQVEQLFRPLTPCRIVDTRGHGGPILANTARSFFVAGTTGFPGQGGHTNGCGVPAGATSVALSVTAAGPLGNGYLTGYAAGTPAPLSNFATLNKGFNSTSNPVLPIAATAGAQLTIRAGAATTQVIIDVAGYYVPQMEAYVQGNTLFSGTSRITGLTHTTGSGSYSVAVDSSVFTCTAQVTGTNNTLSYTAITSSNSVTVTVKDSGGTPTDSNFNLLVVC